MGEGGRCLPHARCAPCPSLPHPTTPPSPTRLAQVHLGLLEGRATHVVWPPSRMGRIKASMEAGKLIEVSEASPEAGAGYG